MVHAQLAAVVKPQTLSPARIAWIGTATTSMFSCVLTQTTNLLYSCATVHLHEHALKTLWVLQALLESDIPYLFLGPGAVHPNPERPSSQHMATRSAFKNGLCCAC